MDEERIYNEARKRTNPADRIAWVDEACGGDAQLKLRILERLGLREAGEPDQTLVFRADVGKDQTVILSDAVEDEAAGDVVVTGEASAKELESFDAVVDESRVTLRSVATEGDDPITQPQSEEMPDVDPKSRYRLDGEIARGGMGAILLGRDGHLGRDLAIKVLLESHRDRGEVIHRFVEEAQIAGQLQHPGITPVYDMGQFSDGRPFFAMKLVKGETLSRLLSDRQDPSVDRGKFIGIFEQICQTMAYVHARGVIHRDLKTANIMVGAFGEVQVMDWGLAKLIPRGGVADEKQSHADRYEKSIIQTLRSGDGSADPGTDSGSGSKTLVGSVMGTPSYMPPEQALGEVDQMNERADVFALGAILCEILTGEPPYTGPNALRHALQGKLDTCMARLDACSADADLVRLAKDCLNLEPVDRPRDATVLAEQVTAYLESVEARLRKTELDKVEAQARTEEFVRRRKLYYAIAGLLLVGLITAGFAAAHFRTLEQTQRTLTREKSDLAASNLKLAQDRTEERDRAERATYRATIRHAESMLQGDDKARHQIADLLWGTRPDLRGWEWGYVMARCPLEQWSLPTEHGELSAMTCSADGHYLATAGADGMVALWDARSRQEVWRLQVGPVAQLRIDTQGKFLAVAFDGDSPFAFTVFGLSDGRRVARDAGGVPAQVAFHPSGDVLYVKSGTMITRYETQGWRKTSTASADHRSSGGAMFVDRAGTVVGVQTNFVPRKFLGKFPSRYQFFDATTLAPRADLAAFDVASEPLHLHVGPILDTDRGTLIHASGNNGIFRRSRADSGMQEELLAEGLPGRIIGLDYDAQTGSVVATSDEGSVQVIDAGGEVRDVYHGTPVRAVAELGADLFVTGGADGLLKCWTLARRAVPPVNQALEGPRDTGALAAFLEDQRLFCKTWRRDYFWLVDTQSMQSEKVEVSGLEITNAFRPKADEVVVRSQDALSLYSVESLRRGQPVERSMPIDRPFLVRFNADGRMMVVNRRQKGPAVFDLETSQPLPDPQLADILADRLRLAISPSGARGAVFTATGVQVWDVPTGRKLDALEFDGLSMGLGSPGGYEPAFHPDNVIVAVIDSESRIVIRDTDEQRDLQVIAPILGVAFWQCLFTPDGERLLVQCSDSRTRLFDWRDGRELLALSGATLTRHHCPLAVSSDGRTIAYGGHNPTMRVAKALPWDMGSRPSAAFYRAVAELRQR